MKRITWWPQAWLGMVFTWGLLVGWTQLRADNWDALAAIYLGAALWVIGYDTIYALQDREDDALVGIRRARCGWADIVTGGVALCYAGAMALWALAFWLYRADWIALLALIPVPQHISRGRSPRWTRGPANPLDRFRSNRWQARWSRQPVSWSETRRPLGVSPAKAYLRPPYGRPKPSTFDKQRVAADNRRAKFDYHIEDTYEAGSLCRAPR